EGLGEVIVRAAVQPDDAVVHAVSGGQHEDWGALAAGADGFARRKSIHAGNHHVQYDQIVIVDFCLIDGVVSASHDVDCVGLFTQPLGYESGDSRVIFHQEKSHARIIRQFVPGEKTSLLSSAHFSRIIICGESPPGRVCDPTETPATAT